VSYLNILKKFNNFKVSAVFSMTVGAFLGFGSAWWFSFPIPPWISFDNLEAYYYVDSKKLVVSGQYIIERECKENSVWRLEAISTNTGYVARYGKPSINEISDITAGKHEFKTTIPIVEVMFADSWRVRLFVSCASALRDTIVSPPIPVIFIEPGLP
jgi:hypothetical protein